MTSTDFFPPIYECADDLMRAAIENLVKSQDRFSASRGEGNEILGANFRLKNPRARLSRSEMRGKVYSALGELFWCLAGSNKVSFIEHYIKNYIKNSDDKQTIHGAYGPRVFGEGQQDQIRQVVDLLKRRQDTRRAVIQIFASSDLAKDYKDVPCTCTLQVFLRGEQLHLVTYMRSNDAYLGLPHDIFVFTMMQELIARSLGVDVGFYQHMVGHLHLYDADRSNATAYLSEGFQSIEAMPPMPSEDPMPLLPKLLNAEEAIRMDPTSAPVSQFPAYWDDIFRLLRIHSENHHKRDGYKRRVASIKSQMNSRTYNVYFRIAAEE